MGDDAANKEQRRKERLARRRARKRERILDAAFEVWCEPDEVFSLEAVADVLALTSASLYHYFDGKSGLLFELAMHIAGEDVAHFVDVVDAVEGGPEAFVALIRRFRAYYGDRLERLELLLRVLSSEVESTERRDRAFGIVTPLVSLLREKLEHDLHQGRLLDEIVPDKVAKTSLIYCSSVAVMLYRFHYQGASAAFDTDELIDELCHTIYRSLCGRPEPSLGVD